MPSRRVLKSVAHDVSEALVSRNDDLGGYWTLGQLLSRVLASNNPSFTVTSSAEQAAIADGDTPQPHPQLLGGHLLEEC